MKKSGRKYVCVTKEYILQPNCIKNNSVSSFISFICVTIRRKKVRKFALEQSFALLAQMSKNPRNHEMSVVLLRCRQVSSLSRDASLGHSFDDRNFISCIHMTHVALVYAHEILNFYVNLCDLNFILEGLI